MGNRTDAFVVPAGLVFEHVDGALAIEHEGDVVLHGDLGQRLHSVRSTEGDVELHIDADLNEIAAPNGAVRVSGSLRADSVVARAVEVGGALSARGVYGGAIEVRGDVDGGEMHAQQGGLVLHGSVRLDGALTAEGGSVVVHGPLRAGSVSSATGDVVLHGVTSAAEISAAGKVVANGAVAAKLISAVDAVELNDSVEAETVRADRVSVRSKRAVVKVVQGRSSIDVGAGQIQADILIAPLVALSPQTTGRVTVVESRADLGPNAVKGCLSLQDLESMLGNVDRFLSERGLERLDDGAGGVGPAPVPVEAETEPTPAVPDGGTSAEQTDDDDTFDGVEVDDENPDDAPTDLDPAAVEPASEDSGESEPAAIVEELFDLSSALPEEEAGAPATDDWDVGETAAPAAGEEWSDEGNSDDDEDLWGLDGPAPAGPEPAPEPPAPEPPPEPVIEDDDEDEEAPVEEPDPIHALLTDTVGRITECYAGIEIPPAVARLQTLVKERAYTTIRDDITDIWNQLLKFHQKRGLRIQPQVTTTFNTINTIVRKL